MEMETVVKCGDFIEVSFSQHECVAEHLEKRGFVSIKSGIGGYYPRFIVTDVYGPTSVKELGTRVSVEPICFFQEDNKKCNKNLSEITFRYIVLVLPDHHGIWAVCGSLDRKSEPILSSGFHVRPWEIEESESVSRLIDKILKKYNF